MDAQVQEILKQCTVSTLTLGGITTSIVKLPEGHLDRAVYAKVAKALEGIGGKWKGAKTMGFVFPHDPTEMLEEISGGKKINLKKEFQFFATPDALCDKLVSLADVNEKHSILEPSAGDGAIIKAINRVLPTKIVDCFELMGVNRMALEKLDTANLIGTDFLEAKVDRKYDRIIANPPFSKNQDIDHLYKMYNCLKEGGRVVCVTSTHWKLSSNKKETDFRTWLDNTVDASIEDVDAGTFKGSGTMVPTVIITIIK